MAWLVLGASSTVSTPGAATGRSAGAPVARGTAPNSPPAAAPEGGAGTDDGSVTKRVEAQLADAAPAAAHVSVSTRNNIVTLSGRVGSETMRKRVVSLAIATDGVAAVNDQLVVVPRRPEVPR
jgi:hypothetical protein